MSAYDASLYRYEVLDLATKVAHGQVSRRCAVFEVLPLIASPLCYQPDPVFDALVEAVRDERRSEVARLLALLTREAA